MTAFKRILFCTDFSENSERAFEHACSMVTQEQGQLYLMHIVPVNPYFHSELNAFVPAEQINQFKVNIRKNVEKAFQERYLPRCDAFKSHVVIREGNAYEEIIQFAEIEKVDLIIMGTSSAMPMGHVVSNVVMHSQIPVLIVPAPKKK